MWQSIIEAAYPEFQAYCKTVLKSNVTAPSLDDLIRWYKWIEYYNASKPQPVIAPDPPTDADE